MSAHGKTLLAGSVVLAGIILSGCGSSSGGTNATPVQTKSYFYYENPKLAKGKLYFEDTVPKAELQNVVKVYLDDVIFSAPGCSVIEDSLNTKQDITNKQAVDFTISFAKNCYANTMEAKGETRIFFQYPDGMSKEDVNGFDIQLKNISPVVDESGYYGFDLKLYPQTLSYQEIKKVDLLILDRGEPIDPQKVKKVSVIADSGNIVLFDTKENNATKVLEEFERVNEVIFYVKPKENKTSYGKVKIVAWIEGNKDYTIEKTLIFNTKEVKPDFTDTSAKIVATYPPFLRKGDEGLVEFKVISQVTGKPVPNENVKLLSIKVENPDFGAIDVNGEYKTSVTFEGDEATNDKKVLVYGKKEGVLKLNVVSKVSFNGYDKNATYNINIPIEPADYSPNISISKIYSDFEDGKFYDYYKIFVEKGHKGMAVDFGGIFPKVVGVDYDAHPENFYIQENPYVYYDSPVGENTGILVEREGRAEFLTDRYDLEKVSLEDRLVVMPNSDNSDKTFMGEWRIKEIVSEHNMLLYNLSTKERTASDLSFMIGRSGKYNPITYSFDYMELPQGKVGLDGNGSAVVKVGYTSFLAGKDAIFYAQVNINGTRYANTKVETLKGGTAIDADIPPCQQASCTYPVRLSFQENGEPLSYVHVYPQCQTSDVAFYDFQRDVDGLIRTNKNGYIYVYIEPTMQETTNTRYLRAGTSSSDNPPPPPDSNSSSSSASTSSSLPDIPQPSTSSSLSSDVNENTTASSASASSEEPIIQPPTYNSATLDCKFLIDKEFQF